MANININPLRRAQLTGAGTITVPANETWIIKTANVAIALAVANKSAKVTATIDSNAYLWFYYGWGTSPPLTHDGKNLIGSTVVMKSGDTIIATNISAAFPATFILDIGYYILEQDF